jgi:hypothetical protein
VTQSGLASEANTWGAFLSSHGFTIGNNSQIVIATQSGTCPQGFYAPGCFGGTGYYCARHTSSNNIAVPFTNLPYVIDSGAGCGENSVQNQWDGFSIVGGHEYGETITDPFPVTGWWDSADSSGGEIGDKCAWTDLGVLPLSTGSFAVQPLYSNAAFSSTGTGCVRSAGDTVTVTNPGNQTSTAGVFTKLQMMGSSSGGHTLTWSATGLPAGLKINASTGRISGTPNKVSSYNVTVTATDTTSAMASASFTWTITSGGGAITSALGKCLDDFMASTNNHNKIDIWTCNGSPAQQWTYTGGMLKVVGKCLDDPRYHGAGTPQILYSCNGGRNQMWTHMSNGEYVGYHGLCLTDPGSSMTNGTQVTLDVCTGAANQVWSLPTAKP